MKSKKFVLLVTAMSLLSFAFGQIHFQKAAGNLGVEHQTKFSNYGSSVSAFDFDQDGWDDLVLGSGMGDSLQFYRNQGGVLVPKASPFEESENAKQLMWVDFDNDGDKDFFILNHLGVSKLYRNNGAWSFTDITSAAGLPNAAMPNWTAAWGDYDRDGWLDLYWTNNTFTTAYTFTNMLFRNNRNGGFTNTTQYAAVQDSNKNPLATVFFDYDNDRWPDIFIAQDKMHGNVLLHNLGNGKFEDVSMPTHADSRICSMNAGISDYDNNGFFDVYVTNSPPGNVLLRNNGNNTFTDVAGQAGVGYYDESWGGNFADFDNDGWPDLYVSGGAAGSMQGIYRNNQQGAFFRLYNAGMNADTASAYANAIADFNRDGLMDIVSNNKAPDSSIVWMNNSQAGHFLSIYLKGSSSNLEGVGSTIEVHANGKRQLRHVLCGEAFMAQNSQYQLFGLGADLLVDSVKVLWPSGHTDILTNVTVDQRIMIEEGSTSPVIPQIFHYGETTLCGGGSVELYTGRFASYVWSTGDTTASITVSSPGLYSVTTTDQWGNVRISMPQQVLLAPNMSAQILENQPSCAGDSGWVDVNTILPAGNYTVTWSNGGTGMSSGMMAPGIGSCTITDAFGCAATVPYSLVAPSPIVLAGLANTPMCAQGMDGSIDLTVAGGAGGFQYMWSNGAQVEDIFGIAGGYYEVTVTDLNGCSESQGFVVNSPTMIFLNTSVGYNAGGSYASVQPMGGTPPYTYLWSDVLGSTGDTAFGLAPLTSYVVWVTDANGCTESANVTTTAPLALGQGHDFGLSAWPQPFGAQLQIAFESANGASANFSLTDLSGRVLKSGLLESGLHVMNLEEWAAGIYLLQVEMDGFAKTIRLMKAN